MSHASPLGIERGAMRRSAGNDNERQEQADSGRVYEERS